MNIEKQLSADEIKKQDIKTIFICFFAYAAAYIGRLNYSAVLVSLIADLNVAKDEAGLVSSFFFFAYGIGQLINGILCKRYNTKNMVFMSLTVSSVINLIMGFCNGLAPMKYLWLLNGAVQSVLWCCIIKTVAERVSEERFDKAVLVMSMPNVIGTVIVYAVSAGLVKIEKWRLIFVFAAVTMITAALMWIFLYGRSGKYIPQESKISTEKKPKKRNLSALLLLPLIFTALAGIADGFIKDGVNTWVTSVLHEQFGVSGSFSILLSLSLPMVGVFGAFAVVKLNKKITSPSALNLIFYAGAFVCCLLLTLFIHQKSFLGSMICFVLIAFIMSMINNVVTSIFPLQSRHLADSGFLAGLLNAFCYVGSTAATYLLGRVAENDGWNRVFLIITMVAPAAGIICGIGTVIGHIRNKKEKSE